jgi:transposase
VRDDANCRRLMTAPGIGAVVAASYVAAIESPANFKHARDVSLAAPIGLARAP